MYNNCNSPYSILMCINIIIVFYLVFKLYICILIVHIYFNIEDRMNCCYAVFMKSVSA